MIDGAAQHNNNNSARSNHPSPQQHQQKSSFSIHASHARCYAPPREDNMRGRARAYISCQEARRRKKLISVACSSTMRPCGYYRPPAGVLFLLLTTSSSVRGGGGGRQVTTRIPHLRGASAGVTTHQFVRHGLQLRGNHVVALGAMYSRAPKQAEARHRLRAELAAASHHSDCEHGASVTL